MSTPSTTDDRTGAAEKTFFLPAERAPRAEVLRQHALLSGDPLIAGLLDSSLSLTMILNEQRQAVFINEAFRVRLGLADSAADMGSRLGEYLGCLRASTPPAGCGTTEACRDCGAARATASAGAGRAAVQACRIQPVLCGQDLSLTVQVTPFPYKGEKYLLLSASDTAHEARRRQLEQIFFHDVLNTASGVQGLLHIMQDRDLDVAVDKYLPIATRASDTLIEELLSQRDVISAENGELHAKLAVTSARSLVLELTEVFAAHPLASNRRIEFTPGSDELLMKTDKTLLSRVIANLIKNALEAVPPGEAVEVSCQREYGAVVILVHNPTFMPPEVQHQVFQRSYSTKGAGRGFGTYSIRLLTENYLGGKVSFSSNPDRGTTFRAEYPLAPTP